MEPVTDPALLAQLNGAPAAPPPPAVAGGLVPVTDPELLKQLDQAAPAPSGHGAVYDKLRDTVGDTGADMAAAGVGGLRKGVYNIAGMFGSLQEARDHAVDYMLRKGIGLMTGREMPSTVDMVAADRLPSAHSIAAAVDPVVGKPYEPHTKPGEYAQRVVESAAVPGGAAASAISAGAGVAGKAAGDATGNPLVDAGLQLVLNLGANGVRSLMSGPAKQIAGAIENVTEQQLEAAQQLMKVAREQHGIELSGAQAIAAVTGGNRLTDIQRVVENSRGGRPVMEPFNTEQGRAATAAVEREIGNVAPPVTAPSTVGPRVQAAAEQTIEDARKGINAQTAPLYKAAEGVALPPQEFATLTADPTIKRIIASVRGDTDLNKVVSHLPDNSVGVLDAAKKRLDAEIGAAKTAGEKDRVAVLMEAVDRLKVATDNASATYAAARQGQTMLRGAVLDPLEQGPLGAMRDAKGTGWQQFEQQAGVLFGKKAGEGSAKEIGDAVRSVAASDPDAARSMVRLYLKERLDAAAGAAQGTEGRQFAGARFAQSVAGREQQAQNLRAAIEGLPAGKEVADGFASLIQTLKATGERARAGSATAFNAELQREMERLGVLAEGAATVASPGSWLTWAKDMKTRIASGRNTEQLAEILTDPNSIDRMRELARTAPNSARAAALTGAILGFNRGETDDRAKK